MHICWISVYAIVYLELVSAETRIAAAFTPSELTKYEPESLHVSSERPLMSGDTFTPYEFLPVSRKLLKKVQYPEGTGFVSSTRSAQDLADKLYAKFFLTGRRIVTLIDEDLSGLDALQALALSGDSLKLHDEEGGKQIRFQKHPHKCRFKLLVKHNETFRSQKIDRRAIDLAKKLAKKRRLKVNLGRRDLQNGATNLNNRKSPGKIAKGVNKDSIKAKCRWRYECKNGNDLGTCDVDVECSNTTFNDIGISSGPDVINIDLARHFRRALKISPVDEEVEKIIEHHFIQLKILRMREQNHIKQRRADNLGNYFDRLRVAVHLGTTTPINIPESAEAVTVRKEAVDDSESDEYSSVIEDNTLFASKSKNFTAT